MTTSKVSKATYVFKRGDYEFSLPNDTDVVTSAAGALLAGIISQRDFNMIRFIYDDYARRESEGIGKKDSEGTRCVLAHAGTERDGGTKP